MEQGEPAEVYYESKAEASLVGNIYAGRVENVIPTLQAAFVDIGVEKNAYLYYGKKRAASDEEKTNRPKAGETVLVQVEKDAVGEKGAVLTREISFAGKFLVLLPGEAGEIGISRKIAKEEERQRIRGILEQILPKEHGVIVRTNGAGRVEPAFQAELGQLLEKWNCLKQAEYRKPPALLWRENLPALKAARDFYAADVDSFVVNDKETYEKLLETGDFNGEGQPKLELYQDKIPLFSAFYVESKLEKALQQRVWLKSGGFLVIEETEACVVMDVNTGKINGKGDLEKTIRKTNLEAAEEAARQMRLRNLSGIIIIDFVDMVHEEDRRLVTKTLEMAVAKDRIKTVVVGLTQLGLMQVTRKKTRPSLLRQISTKCRSCEGSGRVFSPEWIVAKMRRETRTILAGGMCPGLLVHGDRRLLAAYAGKDGCFLRQMEEEYLASVTLCEQEGAAYGWYDLERQEKRIGKES
nr:Rne/Rng family ribonuclease [Anaerotignum lactatifermentans]